VYQIDEGHFSGKSDSKYNYKAVKKTMQIIQDQDLAITEYVRSNDLSCMTVFYEDLIADPGIVLRKILPDGYSEISPHASDLKLQSNETNQEWARRFYAESAKRQ